MALLQILEPGSPNLIDRKHIAIGIDLGTTHSLVAAKNNGAVKVIPDLDGKTLLPSIVRYTSNSNLVGQIANHGPGNNQLEVLRSAKRLMGRSMEHVSKNKELKDFFSNYQLHNLDGQAAFYTDFGLKTPIEISSDILKVLRKRAEHNFSSKIFGAVITVPAYFDDLQRQATKEAARLAGLNVLRLLNEPTAAAIAYGLDKNVKGTYAVYDLGGGTFDLSILRLRDGVFNVLATNGNTALGGDDFDIMLYHYIVRKMGLSKEDIASKFSEAIQSIRWAKEKLSEVESVVIPFKFNNKNYEYNLFRSALDEVCKPLIDLTIQLTCNSIQDADLKLKDIDGVVLVGGSTRMLSIRDAVANLFGKPPLCDLHPDEAVAIGAAMHADLLMGNNKTKEWLLLDVTPLSLGLETSGGIVEKIIPRNSTIPVSKEQEFTTMKDEQTSMSFHVVQGERELAKDCHSLTKFEFHSIPPLPAGKARIRVRYQIDADGLLSVSAKEVSTGKLKTVNVQVNQTLTKKDITTLLTESKQSFEKDKIETPHQKIIFLAEKTIEELNSAIASDGDLLEKNEKMEILQQKKKVLNAIKLNEINLIESETRKLIHLSNKFAIDKMNRKVSLALINRNINDLSH